MANITVQAMLGAERALRQLRARLQQANTDGLAHNDPMPANIIFTMNAEDEIGARLLDFELAQDLHAGSPDYVVGEMLEYFRDKCSGKMPDA